MTEPKMTRLVGFDRPATAFPEDVANFFPGFMLERLAARFINTAMDHRIVDATKIEALQMLAIANDIYKLGLVEPVAEFWSVEIEKNEDKHSMTANVLPAGLRGCFFDLTDEAPGKLRLTIVFSPRDDEEGLFVVAPSTIEAFIAMARMIKVRRKS